MHSWGTSFRISFNVILWVIHLVLVCWKVSFLILLLKDKSLRWQLVSLSTLNFLWHCLLASILSPLSVSSGCNNKLPQIPWHRTTTVFCPSSEGQKSRVSLHRLELDVGRDALLSEALRETVPCLSYLLVAASLSWHNYSHITLSSSSVTILPSLLLNLPLPPFIRTLEIGFRAHPDNLR